MSLPKLAYTVSQNVESSDGILALCNNSILAVLFSLLLEKLFLRPVTIQMVKLRHLKHVPDELAFNQSYAGSIFVTVFFSNVFWPTLLTFYLDENWYTSSLQLALCLVMFFACRSNRFYLQYSKSLRDIMSYW